MAQPKKIVLDDDDVAAVQGAVPDRATLLRQARTVLTAMIAADPVNPPTPARARAQLEQRYGYTFGETYKRFANDAIREAFDQINDEPETPAAAAAPAVPPAKPSAPVPFVVSFGDDDELGVYDNAKPLPAPKKPAAPKASPPKASPAPSPARAKKPAPVSLTPTRDEVASNDASFAKPSAPATKLSPPTATQAPAKPVPLAKPSPPAGTQAPAKPDRVEQLDPATPTPKRTAKPSAPVPGGAGDIVSILRTMDTQLATTAARLDDETPTDNILVEMHLQLTASHTSLLRAVALNRVSSAASAMKPPARAPRKPAAKGSPAPSSSSSASTTPSPMSVDRDDSQEEGWDTISAEIGKNDTRLTLKIIANARAKLGNLIYTLENEAPELFLSLADLLEAEIYDTIPRILDGLNALARSVPIKEMDTNSQLVYPVAAGELFGVPQSGVSKLLESTAQLDSLPADSQILAMCAAPTGPRDLYAVIVAAGGSAPMLFRAEAGGNWKQTMFKEFLAGERVRSIAVVESDSAEDAGKVILNILYASEATPFRLQRVALPVNEYGVAGLKNGVLGKKLGDVPIVGSALGGPNGVLYAQLKDGLVTMSQFDLTTLRTVANASFSIAQLDTRGARPVVVASRNYAAMVVADVSPAFQDAASKAVLASSGRYLGVRVMIWRMIPGNIRLQLVVVASLVVEGLLETLGEQLTNLPCCLSDDGTLLFAIGARNSAINRPTRIYAVRAYKTGASLVYESAPTSEISESVLVSGQTGQLIAAHSDGSIRELVPSYAPSDFSWHLSA
jgi:hypothetical protein